jgi:hypothetical protein
MHIRHSLSVFAIGLAASAANAGQISNGSWQPANCGTKPDAPTIDLKDPDAYNRSVEAANTYNKAISSYLDCLVKEANADIQLISQNAKGAQQSAREVADRFQAAAKEAEAKFK